MDHLGEIIWTGASGRKYTYFIYPIGTKFIDVPGNYVFAKATPEGHYALYVGETGALSERFDNHHKMPCIERRGATHIHVHKSSDDDEIRRAEEADIIAQWNPPCNG